MREESVSIWGNNGWKFSKNNEKYQTTDAESSENPKQGKYQKQKKTNKKYNVTTHLNTLYSRCWKSEIKS